MIRRVDYHDCERVCPQCGKDLPIAHIESTDPDGGGWFNLDCSCEREVENRISGLEDFKKWLELEHPGYANDALSLWHLIQHWGQHDR